jgi:hypothetical protein
MTKREHRFRRKDFVSKKEMQAYYETAWPVFTFTRKEKPFRDVASAFWWLQEHPLYLKHFEYEIPESMWESGGLYIHYAKVDPKTKRITGDKSKNAHTEVWLESGPWYSYEIAVLTGEDPEFANKNGLHSHDIRLDCGGDTFEAAILKLAGLVNKFYGNYKMGNKKDAQKAWTKICSTQKTEKLLDKAQTKVLGKKSTSSSRGLST